uniref:Uncharacterized protein n=1 Tax=Junco hyemalis TaxID=40217 RepID=A0A8C5NKU3_JUNHY
MAAAARQASHWEASTSALGYVLTASTCPILPLVPRLPWHHTGMLAHHYYSETPGVSAGPLLAKTPSSDPREAGDKSTAASMLPCKPRHRGQSCTIYLDVTTPALHSLGALHCRWPQH